MADQAWLAERFEEHRAHLRAVAYRVLGSASEADDAVQESWIRLSRADTSDVENLRGWLTTVVGRVCLDMLRSRDSRRETPISEHAPEQALSHVDGVDPEHEAVLADSVGLAMLVVLETLTPAERIAFVLHDMFAVSFDEIAPIVGRSPAATRQLASRARRRVRGGSTERPADANRKREVVAAFLAASREGRFDALLALLDPEAVVRADGAAMELGASAYFGFREDGTSEVRGARAVANMFSGRARAAQLAIIDGAPGAVWAVAGRPRAVFRFTVHGGRVAAIELVADQDSIGHMVLEVAE